MEVVRITLEETYGFFDTTSPVQQNFFLPVGNAMTVRTKPTFWRVTDASQGNRPVRANIARKLVGGTLQTYLFPSQAAFLLNFAAGLTGSAPCFDLPSFTLDHAIYGVNCTPFYKRYLGCKIGQFRLSCDQSDQGCLVSVNAQIVGSTVAAITGTDLPAQALTSFPADDPFRLFDAAGHLTIGTARTNWQTLDFSIANATQAFMDENQFAQRVQYFGRVTTFSSKLLYKTAADRTAYEAGTKQAVSFEFDNGVNTLTINMQGKNNIEGVEDDIPLDNFPTQSLNLTALVDPATGTDLTFTVT